MTASPNTPDGASGSTPEAQLRSALSRLLAYDERRVPLDPTGYQHAARELNSVLMGPFKQVLHRSFDRAPQIFRDACANAYFELHGRFPLEANAQAPWLQAVTRLVLHRAARRGS